MQQSDSFCCFATDGIEVETAAFIAVPLRMACYFLAACGGGPPWLWTLAGTPADSGSGTRALGAAEVSEVPEAVEVSALEPQPASKPPSKAAIPIREKLVMVNECFKRWGSRWCRGCHPALTGPTRSPRSSTYKKPAASLDLRCHEDKAW